MLSTLFAPYTEYNVQIQSSASSGRAKAIRFYLLNPTSIKMGQRAVSVNTLILTRSVLYVVRVN